MCMSNLENLQVSLQDHANRIYLENGIEAISVRQEMELNVKNGAQIPLIVTV